MIEIYKTIDDQLKKLEELDKGVWVNLTNPTEEEILWVSQQLDLELEHIRAALDEEERPRIETSNGCTLILVDIPIPTVEEHSGLYTTLPLGIILNEDSIVTVSLKKNAIINDFIEGKVKSFYTFKRTRFILQLLYKNATYFLQYLRQIEKTSYRIELELHKSMKNKELIELLDLEKSLVYFSTSLKSNEIVLEKMLKLDSIKKYPEDTDLLEDVMIENKQAIEMASIHINILTGTMDAFASVISNNLNIVMKFLTSITIVLSIPTMIASFFGMNVDVPFENNPHAFMIIVSISTLLSVFISLIFIKRKMF
ncbi:magnesium transporter CorA family protein [Tepidibacillus fermentans]|uniref:Magnesium transporter n=1 Tax=Tepidibacillus fermentans TaxID=1281767 RepID=A0A4R3KLU3_9BACI|nr:magnesium transporter CorA family protein [Tepidibacillus fermentans]TCS84572.1 magnesium transporter [Tepidibacillus fermentans]